MADPILDTVVAVATAIVENPVAGPLVLGVIRSATGWVQKKLKIGEDFDKKQLGATMTKYLVAVNAMNVFLPPKYSSALVILVDIGYSVAKKLKNGEP